MSKNRFLVLPLALFCFFGACIRQTPPLPPMEISLYSGVSQLARLSDSVNLVKQRAEALKLEPEVADVSKDEGLKAARVNLLFRFPTAGLRIYFREGHVVLIEAQEPFNGRMVGRNLNLFPFKASAKESTMQGSWEEILVHEFGSPRNQMSGGRLGSEALLYSWGDISFNGMGPNEIAIYKDAFIAHYRESNFGRVLSLMPK